MKKKYILILLSIIVLLVVTQFWENKESSRLSFTQIPSDFEYDGCSMFPDWDYWDCCKTHDDAYFFGGTWRERLSADNDFYVCLKEKWKWYHQVLAPNMWAGVRIWWAPIFPTPYRWGFWRDRYE